MTAATATAILEPPADRKRLGHPQPRSGIWGNLYADLLPDGRRHWLLPDGEVTDPAWDYDKGAYTGTRNGSPWSAPWSPELTWHITSQVSGYCTEAQGLKLFDLAAYSAPRGTIVEIGSAKGLSATWLGLGARSAAGPAASVYCVDTFIGPNGNWGTSVLPVFRANMHYAGLRDICHPIEAKSRDAVQGWDGTPLSLIYVDAFHSYSQAKFDYEAWARFAIPGAIVAFDDCLTEYPGVMQLQRELAAAGKLELLGRVDALLWWRLPSAAS